MQPPHEVKGFLWRGIARMRLGDPMAKSDLMLVLHNYPQSRVALVHLLPVLITAAGMGPQGNARTVAEGYVNLALAKYPQDPYVRLCAALLARRVGDAARAREMLAALVQTHTDYGPAYTTLAALEAEVYAQSHDPNSRAKSLTLCRQNLALAQNRDMALCLINALVKGWPLSTIRPNTPVARVAARYERLLVAPEDVWALPLVVLDPVLAQSAA